MSVVRGLRKAAFGAALGVAAAGVGGGCADAVVARSERETGRILGELHARVEGERAAAREKADKALAKPPEEVEVPEVLALRDALRIASRTNRDLLGDREGLVLAALALLNARRDVGPRLSGSVASLLTGSDRAEEVRTNSGTLSVTDLLPTGANVTVTGDAEKTWGRGDDVGSSAAGSVTARIRQPLLRGAGWESSHEALTDAERQALYDVRQFELGRQDLALRVQREFYGLVAQKQVIRNRETALGSFEFLKRRSEALFALGRVSEVDKFRATREYLIAENALVDARQEYEARLDRFKVLLGLPTSTRLDVAEEIPERREFALELRAAIDVALANRLDLMNARDQVDDAERRERIRARDMLPDLAVEAVGTRTDPGGGRRLRDVTPLERDTYSLGFSLELPLDRVRERGALRAARIALARARRDLSLREDTVVLEVRESLRNLRSAQNSLAIQEQIAASEEKNVKVARLRFERGEIGNRDLTEALASLADAQDRLVREKTNVETARTQLLRELGVLVLDEEGMWRE